jgi:hypothetical protein
VTPSCCRAAPPSASTRRRACRTVCAPGPWLRRPWHDRAHRARGDHLRPRQWRGEGLGRRRPTRARRARLARRVGNLRPRHRGRGHGCDDSPISRAASALPPPRGTATRSARLSPPTRWGRSPSATPRIFMPRRWNSAMSSAASAPRRPFDPTRLPPTKVTAVEREATAIAIVATDAALTKAQCARLATMAQDGIARAVWPSHAPMDGDVVFAVSTGARPIARGHAANRPHVDRPSCRALPVAGHRARRLPRHPGAGRSETHLGDRFGWRLSGNPAFILRPCKALRSARL